MRFNKVLIANRGEIAIRLIRACHKLNLKAVAVFSDADENALHVALADEAIHIGASEARASYLDADKIIQAALQTGAGAIHPGYGFLSENADFAQRCGDAGIVFVGPSPEVIASMGAKIEAKRIAEKAGVHCVPGYHGDDQSDAMLMQEAERIGTPLLIKASAGGGGRGMRRIDDLSDFQASLSLARDEAKAAFGDPSVLLEKFVEAPRHIEVQILADKHGNVRHLYERDCSVQRNYQKVIEEAPAPNLSPELREQILGDAVKLCEAIGYDNAGTVEFVADAANNVAYFLEMNTRLQVEHPVTEMITGMDLAQWQLRVAAGEELDFKQADVQVNGWAIEARVAAENPAQGYQPETGLITSYLEPELPGLRVDSGICKGSDISPYYDSMLAKVIAYGSGRDEAMRRLQQGLADYQIGGVGVNTAFLYELLDLPAFKAGEHLTSLISSSWPEGWQQPAMSDRELAIAALAWHSTNESSGAETAFGAWASLGAWRIAEHNGRPAEATYYLSCCDGEVVESQVLGRAGQYSVRLNGETLLEARQVRWHNGQLSYREGDALHQLAVEVDGKQVTLRNAAQTLSINVLLAEDMLLGEGEEKATLGNQVLAPTPGLIAEVLVTPGDSVTAGQAVVVLEALKLYQELTAPSDGVIAQLHCQAGDSVNGGDVLVSFESAEGQEEGLRESA